MLKKVIFKRNYRCTIKNCTGYSIFNASIRYNNVNYSGIKRIMQLASILNKFAYNKVIGDN